MGCDIIIVLSYRSILQIGSRVIPTLTAVPTTMTFVVREYYKCIGYIFFFYICPRSIEINASKSFFVRVLHTFTNNNSFLGAGGGEDK